MIEERRFEELWERAEAREYATRLAAEFPAWHAGRKRAAGIVTSLALAVAVAVPLAHRPQPLERVYCNNTAYSDSHWTETAAALLMEV